MSRSQKLLLGFLTLLPLILIGIYLVSFFHLFFNAATHFHGGNGEGDFPPFFIGDFLLLLALIGFAALLSLGLMIFYIVRVVNQPQLDSNERLVWILLFIFTGCIGNIIYWYLRIWKEKPPAA